MKTLLEFLIAEGQENNKSEKTGKTEMPPGFTKFELRGSLTSIAQTAIGSTKIRAVLADKSKNAKVAKELDITRQSDPKPAKVMDEIIKGKSAFSELFVTNTVRQEGKSGFIVKMVPEWKDLAGATKSSAKLVYFYMKSAMLAANVDKNAAEDDQVSYGINASTSEVVILPNG